MFQRRHEVPDLETYTLLWLMRMCVCFILIVVVSIDPVPSSAVSFSVQQRMQKRLVRRQQRLEQQRQHLGSTTSAAILDLIYDPHALAEKLFGKPPLTSTT